MTQSSIDLGLLCVISRTRNEKGTALSRDDHGWDIVPRTIFYYHCSICIDGIDYWQPVLSFSTKLFSLFIKVNENTCLPTSMCISTCVHAHSLGKSKGGHRETWHLYVLRCTWIEVALHRCGAHIRHPETAESKREEYPMKLHCGSKTSENLDGDGSTCVTLVSYPFHNPRTTVFIINLKVKEYPLCL